MRKFLILFYSFYSVKKKNQLLFSFAVFSLPALGSLGEDDLSGRMVIDATAVDFSASDSKLLGFSPWPFFKKNLLNTILSLQSLCIFFRCFVFRVRVCCAGWKMRVGAYVLLNRLVKICGGVISLKDRLVTWAVWHITWSLNTRVNIWYHYTGGSKPVFSV